MACSWFYFPNTQRPMDELLEIVNIFNMNESKISSDAHSLSSDDVLGVIASDLRSRGYKVESGKKTEELIKVPVLFKENGIIEKEFNADAFHKEKGIVLEVEAGGCIANNRFLKDLFEACMMQDTYYLCIAARKRYSTSYDYNRVCAFFKTLYASNRLAIPLRGVLILGY